MKAPDKAVICQGAHQGCVLYYAGPGITYEIEDAGLYDLGDLGLDDAPPGISIWEGVLKDGGPPTWSNPDGEDPELVGTFRPPNKAEWLWIADQKSPFKACNRCGACCSAMDDPSLAIPCEGCGQDPYSIALCAQQGHPDDPPCGKPAAWALDGEPICDGCHDAYVEQGWQADNFVEIVSRDPSSP